MNEREPHPEAGVRGDGPTARGWARADLLRLHRQRHGRAVDGDPTLHLVVLGHRPLVGHERILARLPAGAPGLPWCAVGEEPSLVRQIAALVGGLEDVALIAATAVGDDVVPGATVTPTDPSIGTAIVALRAVVTTMLRHPRATFVFAPVDTSWLRAAPLRASLARAVAVAEARDQVVLLGAAGGELARPGRPWLVPFGCRGRAQDVPLSTVAPAPRRLDAFHLEQAGALCGTGFVVAPGSRLLDAFEAITPRLVRLMLFGASLPDGDRETFLARACADLGPLDLVGDILSLGRHLRALVVPDEAGLADLHGELAAVTWLARRRCLRADASRRPYRRVVPSPSPLRSPRRGATAWSRPQAC